MAINAKMGVELSSFEAGIKSGQAMLKGLNAEMKAVDAEFKATGNSEKMLADKTKTLNSQLQTQKNIADQARQALKAMDKEGVDPADASYQKLYATMMNATAGMNEAQAALNALDGSQQQAAKSAGSLADSVNGIGKKISLDQVLSGINSIKSGLESAAQKAVQLGEAIWTNVMDAAKWADDTATQALMYGIDVEKYQQMQKLVQNGLDTTVEAMLTAQSKLKKNIGSESKAAIDALQELGVAWNETVGSGKYGDVTKVRDSMEVFWEAGQKIMALKDDPNAQESMAQALFGRGWKELVPLFDKYKSLEEYNKALEDTTINSEEEVNALAELNDKVGELEGNLDTLGNKIMAQLAPALTDAADALNGLLTSVLEYLETPEGQEMLKGLGDAVTELFSGMKNINAEDVVNGFKDAFDKVMGVLNWIVDNKDAVVTALEGVFGFWATLKVGSGALTILKVINGLKDLAGIGGTGAAASGLTAGLSAGLTTAATNVASVLGSAVLQNIIPVAGDWFTHNTVFGHWMMGTETPEQTASEIQKNIDSFDQDARENVLTGWAVALGENAIKFWDQFWKGNGPAYTPDTMEDADWRPSYMKDIQPVEVETDPVAPDNAAAQLSEEIGTVTVPAELDWRPGYMRGFANGINYVPYDGMLARLHKGERVVPAREIQSRNFSSNLYVENMNMNGGLSADALAASIASRNSRIMAGYGS